MDLLTSKKPKLDCVNLPYRPDAERMRYHATFFAFLDRKVMLRAEDRNRKRRTGWGTGLEKLRSVNAVCSRNVE